MKICTCFKETDRNLILVKLLMVPVNLNFRLEPLLAPGVLTLEGVLGDVGLLLSLVLLGVFGLLVLVQIIHIHINRNPIINPIDRK